MSNWIAITGDDIVKVVSRLVIKNSNENTGADIPPGIPFDSGLANRADDIAAMVVLDFRGAVQTGGRYPVSVQADSVPPDCEREALNLAAYQLFNSIPTLQMAVLTEKGAVSPFAKFYDAALKRLEAIRKGDAVVVPTDPCGVDYLTAVSDTNLAVCGTSWSDMRMTDAEYAAGDVAALDMTTD